jgi:hypothetical protein
MRSISRPVCARLWTTRSCAGRLGKAARERSALTDREAHFERLMAVYEGIAPTAQ